MARRTLTEKEKIQLKKLSARLEEARKTPGFKKEINKFIRLVN
ncbi:MAG: hypothetical protein QME12_00845 [Nanoarchaeota archaeon]|nr:hypothetical protein [Nanoarchaeota archaeon]